MALRPAKSVGISLVETLVSMALLGVIFIPLLFVSSAVFLGQLVQMREQVDVSHGSSRFLSGFMRDLQHARRVLPQSDADNLYLAYFDPVRQREMTVHYQIAASDHLRKFIQNTMTGNWDEVSPYGTLEAGEIDLTSSGTLEFAYCLDTDCSGSTDVSAEPERAVLVQLKDWVFTQGDQSLALPELNVYVSTDSQAGSTFTLSDEVRELYSFDATVPFGAGVNYRLVNLTPTGGHFNHVGMSAGESSGLTTITPSTIGDPGRESTAVSPVDGRVFFGQYGASGHFYTWKEDTGLTTITPVAIAYPGHKSTVVAADGRVFFGQYTASGRFYTWHESTGLSTITPAAISSPGSGTTTVAPNGRVFFGEANSSGHFYTWRENTGLSTITPAEIGFPGYGSAVTSPADGRVFFGVNTNPGHFYTWKEDTGLTTITPSGIPYAGQQATAVSTDGRVFFGNTTMSGHFYTWKEDTGLTTITPAIIVRPGDKSLAVSEFDGRVFFGQNYASGHFYTWKEDTGLTTITPASFDHPGYGSTKAAGDGRIFFGEADSSNGRLYTWKIGTGLSTITPTVSAYPGSGSMAATMNGRVFFGGSGSRHFYTWKEDTGLTTITPTVIASPGRYYSIALSGDRIFFGQDTASGHFYTWKEDTGLTTITPALIAYPGSFYAIAATDDERIYFGQRATGHFYTWSAGGTPTVAMGRSTASGAPTNQGLGFEQLGASYIAATQAAEGDFYLVNTDDDKLDRYTYNTVAKRFERKSQLPLGSWAANVGAVVTDQANDDVALLDTVGQKIYVYGDRTATSGSPTVYDSGNGFDFAVSPTGLAINQRTGDYLVIDSDVTGSAGNERIKLYVVDLDGDTTTATKEKTFFIEIGASGNLSDDLSGETNFKIQYDEAKNILYLMAPSTDKVYALMLPEYL